MMSLVAHELGNSIGRLYLTDRMRQLAVHEDRIRVARDLHDGLEQSLTGIGLQLDIAGKLSASEPAVSDHHLGLARPLAALKPAPSLPQSDLRRSVSAIERDRSDKWLQ